MTNYVEHNLQMTLDYKEINSYLYFDSYQDFTDTTTLYSEDDAIEYLMTGLDIAVASVVSGKYDTSIKDTIDTEALMTELGDCLWFITRIAAENEIYLSDIAQRNVEKYNSRLGGSGVTDE